MWHMANSFQNNRALKICFYLYCLFILGVEKGKTNEYVMGISVGLLILNG